MKAISKFLDFYEKTFGTIALLTMLLLVFYQVIARFIFGSQLRWSEELARYIMLYISFVGIGAGIKYHKHVGVDLFGAVLKPKGKQILMLVIAVLTSVILVIFTYYTGLVSVRIMWIPYATLPLGFFGGILRQCEEIIKIVKTPAEELIRREQEEKAEIAEGT